MDNNNRIKSNISSYTPEIKNDLLIKLYLKINIKISSIKDIWHLKQRGRHINR